MTSKYDTDDYELEFIVKLKRITPLEECSMCNGRGTENMDYYRHLFTSTCSECSGFGEVYTRTDAIKPTIPQSLIDDLKQAWKNHNNQEKICPTCGGGKIDVDQKKEIVCIYCNGSGYEGEGPYACQCCEGTGVEPKVFKCRACNGTGDYEDPATRFETTIECPHCDGYGEFEK